MNICFGFLSWCCVALGVVLFDKSNIRDFSLINVTRDEGFAYLFYTPPGVLAFTNTSTATLRATRSASGGRFSGISAPLNRDIVIAALNTSENMIIDIDYTFSMYDTSDKLSLTGHGTGQYVMLTDDTTEPHSHTGVVVEYGGGSSLNLTPSPFNWTKPGCSIYRFETNENNGLAEQAFVRPPVLSNNALVRYGRFRMLLRFLFSPSDMQRLAFLQMRLEVRNNTNYTGVLVDFVQPASTLAYTRTRVSQWFNRTSTKSPRIYLFGLRTDFDVENLQINATLNRTATSFDGVWGVAAVPSTSTTTTATTASPLPSVATTTNATTTATMQTALTLPPVQETTVGAGKLTNTSFGGTTDAANVSASTNSSATFQGNQTASTPGTSDTTSPITTAASTTTGDDRIAMIATIVCLAVCCVCLMLVVLLRRRIKARFGKQNEEGAFHKVFFRVLYWRAY